MPNQTPSWEAYVNIVKRTCLVFEGPRNPGVEAILGRKAGLQSVAVEILEP
jgi:hypothetical protein